MDKKIRSATEEWVKTFNMVPSGAIRKIEKTLKPLGEKTISHVPMWECMWTFSCIHDKRWLEHGGLEKMINCGLYVFEQEDFGYIFGIDGCGYDFYENHWIPLYKERGLPWHHSNIYDGEKAIVEVGDKIKTALSDETIVLDVDKDNAILFDGRQFVEVFGLQCDNDKFSWNQGNYSYEYPQKKDGVVIDNINKIEMSSKEKEIFNKIDGFVDAYTDLSNAMHDIDYDFADGYPLDKSFHDIDFISWAEASKLNISEENKDKNSEKTNKKKQVRKKFNLSKTIKNLKKDIFYSRKNNDITKEKARELYEYLSEEAIQENIENFRRFSRHNLSHEEEQEKALLLSLVGWNFWDGHLAFTLSFFVYE